MTNTTTQKYFRFLAFMLMISTFLPLLFNNLPPYIKTPHIWSLLWFVSLVVFKSKILQQNLLQLWLLYGAIMLLLLLNTLWIDVNEWNKNQITGEFYAIAVALSVIVYFRMERDYIGLANLVKWTMVFLFITAIMSIVTAIINPSYARDIIGISTAINESAREEILSYQKYGGGGYSFASAIDCLLPILIYYYKNNSSSYFNKKQLILFIIIFLISLISMQIFANILIAIPIIAFSWFGTKNAKRGFITIGLITLIFLLIPSQIYIDLFQYIASWFHRGSELNYKFNDIAQFYATGGSYEESGLGSRAERYPILWRSFQANPFFGHFVSSRKSFTDISAGAHLFWMNKLAVYGLLGTIPFLFIIYRYIKINLRYFDKEFALYFLLSLFSIIVLGSMKTLGGRDFWYTYFIVVPGFYYLRLLKKKPKGPRSGTSNTGYFDHTDKQI
jgi:hypothetical protein